MEQHQERVITEQKELQAKLNKLEAFIDDENSAFNNLPKDEQDRLSKQAFHMNDYNDVLIDRIRNF